jgi:hypothetical protein
VSGRVDVQPEDGPDRPVDDTLCEADDLFVVGEPDNPVFERIVVGAVAYEGKKDKLGVEFHERDPTELGPDELEAASDAVDAKNDFLLEATGRDAQSRRESMKRAVEDDPDHDVDA